MPDPKADSYNRYREGLVKRHIICSGRYLQEVWLKEYEPDKDDIFLLRYKRVFSPPNIGGQSVVQRDYIPWLSEEGYVYGGGENPLLRGGIAMATFSVEYMVKQDYSSLRYATLLLDYVEKCELVDSQGKLTGFFLRCKNIKKPKEIGLHASVDELSGLVLGLYYLYLAAENYMEIRARIRLLVERIGSFLQSNAYMLISPKEQPDLHRGWSASWLYQWAFQQAFQRITGSRYEIRAEHYQAASDKLWEIFQDVENRLKYYSGTKENAILELLGLMYIWGRCGFIDDASAERWSNALRDRGSEADALKLSILDFGPLAAYWFDILKDKVTIEGMESPFNRYVATLSIQDLGIYFWSRDNWHNIPMTFHTLHYALDEETLTQNNDSDRAIILTQVAHGMIKKILCGERVLKPQLKPPFYKTGKSDNDFYASIIAKGLLTKFVPIQGMKCVKKLPFFDHLSPYKDRLDASIEARERMWDELPAGEPQEVRDGSKCKTPTSTWPAQVRWHNNDVLTVDKAKIGTDFCWEKPPGSNERILSRGCGVHPSATGMEKDTVKTFLLEGKDAIFEGGGLDFLFPRVLMSYWLDEPLEFVDPGTPPLRAITCLPFAEGNKLQKAICRRKIDWLLFSSTMVQTT